MDRNNGNLFAKVSEIFLSVLVNDYTKSKEMYCSVFR